MTYFGRHSHPSRPALSAPHGHHPTTPTPADAAVKPLKCGGSGGGAGACYPFPRNPRWWQIRLEPFDSHGVEPIYRAGQVVKGSVRFCLSEPISFRRVTVRLHGLSKVWWLEGTGDQRREYQNLDTYFNDVIVLRTPEDDTCDPAGSSPGELHEGEHSLPFWYRLPCNLPCSVERVGAYIRYSIRAVIDRSWAGLNPSWKRAFTVIDDVDLNLVGGVLRSSEFSKEKRLLLTTGCQLPAAAATKPRRCLVVRAFTDRYGYCPGETVYITLKLLNNTLVNVSAVLLSLQQLVLYNSSTGHRKCQWSHLLTLAQPGCPKRGGRLLLRHVPMHIPSVPMSCDYSKCRCISTSYSVNIKVKFANCLSYSVHLPIVIGSIPIRLFTSVRHRIVHPPPIHLECVLKGGGSIMDDEGSGGERGWRSTGQQLLFTPAYTYYDWQGRYPSPDQLPYTVTGNHLLHIDP